MLTKEPSSKRISFDEFDEIRSPRPEPSAFQGVIDRALTRRSFLGGSIAFSTAAFVLGSTALRPAFAQSRLGFEQVAANTLDTVTVPPGYNWQVVALWGDPLWSGAPAFDETTRGTGASQELAFGDNVDGMHLFYQGGRTILAANNEYTNTIHIHGNRASGTAETPDDVRKSKAAHGVSVVELAEMGGRWGIVLRRQMEAGARTIPLVAIFSLPLFLGLDRIFLWADHAKVEADHLLHHKALYLNPTAFAARFVAFVGLFTLYAYLLSRRSTSQDAGGDRGEAASMQRTSAVGFLLFVLAMSFLGFDWLMSLDPHWFSSLYGAIFLAGAGMAALTFLILVSRRLLESGLGRVYTTKRFHDLGTLLFAFVMFFTYLCISQFIIAYQGNLPEEVLWFQERFHGPWLYVAVGLLVLHFFFPFLILLHRTVKRRATTLARIAGFVLLMRFVDIVWQSRPSLAHDGLGLSWMDASAPLAVGGIWFFLFVRELGKGPVLPVGDPSLAEALGHE